MRLNPRALRDEVANEGYKLIDKHLRKLPKNPDGSIDTLAASAMPSHLARIYVISARYLRI
jgi:hypothetical protein